MMYDVFDTLLYFCAFLYVGCFLASCCNNVVTRKKNIATVYMPKYSCYPHFSSAPDRRLENSDRHMNLDPQVSQPLHFTSLHSICCRVSCEFILRKSDSLVSRYSGLRLLRHPGRYYSSTADTRFHPIGLGLSRPSAFRLPSD
jgi:hypothetical protein